MEQIIGSLKQEIEQPSNYLTNFAKKGICYACVNALLAAMPELDDSQPALPASTVSLGDGYALLYKQDKFPVLLFHGSYGVVWEYLDYPNPMPKIQCWAHLLLPNGQVAQSTWHESFRFSSNL